MNRSKSDYNQFANLPSNIDKFYFFITNIMVTNKSKNVNPRFNDDNKYNTDRYIYFFTLSLSIVSALVLFSMIFVSNAVAFDPHATKYEFIKKMGI